MSKPPEPVSEPFAARFRVARLGADGRSEPSDDLVAVEEPLEIRLNQRPFAVVMRTPGHDLELAAGHLLSEGAIKDRAEILAIAPCEMAGVVADNIVNVVVPERLAQAGSAARRRGPVGSSCGTCGKTSIDEIHRNFPPLSKSTFTLTASILQRLPVELTAQQAVFRATGGLHGIALFGVDGRLIKTREDVGRHNAADKILGYALLNGLMPLDQHILFVSGRISFEIMQKALAGRIGIVAGISAPTSLAVEFARSSGQTLIGFVRDGRANVYAGTLET